MVETPETGGKFKKCPYCAEDIRAEAVVCRFCNKDLQHVPSPAVPLATKQIVQEGFAKDAERRTIQTEVRRRRGWARLVGLGCAIAIAVGIRQSWNVAMGSRFSISSSLWWAAAAVLYIAYLFVRPRYTGAECPHCHSFAVRKTHRSGLVSASYFLRCDDCQGEFGGTGGGCSCLALIGAIGAMASGIVAMLLIVALRQST